MVDSTLTEFFQLLALDDISIRLCSLLAATGPLTVLSLARQLSLPRTSIYRRLSHLTDLGIVAEIISSRTSLFQLAPLDKIHQLVDQHSHQATRLQQLFPQIQDELSSFNHHSLQTQVLYFRGQTAVARMSWGAIQTNGILRCYSSSSHVSELIGLRETEQFRLAWEQTHQQGRELSSGNYPQHPINSPEWTNWEYRQLSDSLLQIHQYMDIYNDIVAIYDWHEGEVYGMQIKNQNIADFHKQLFDLAWSLAKVPPKS